MSFNPIKVKSILKKPASVPKQNEKVQFIIEYYEKALKDDDEFMRLSSIENLIYHYRRGFLDVNWYNVGLSWMDAIDDDY